MTESVRRTSLVLLGVVVLLLGALIVLWPSDERRIASLFREGIQALEAENLDALMSKASFNYRDERGLTYLTLKEWLKARFQVFSEIDVEEGGLTLSVSGDRATALLAVRVLATEGNLRGYVVGSPKEPARLTFTLVRERSRWLVQSCRSINPQDP